jgi:RNA polymerase sigma-70 factor (ECF subfamily)
VDRELVIRAQAGDADAFTSLVASAVDGLYSTSRLILRRDDEAEDAVQDALLRAWLGIRGLRDPDRFEAWLRRLTVHSCYRTASRGRSRRVVEVAPIDVGEPSVPDRAENLAARDQLERGFRRLPVDQRAVLVVHHFLDLSDADASDMLGIPIGTMKSRLHRATAALRAALDADDREPVLVGGRTL